MPTIPTYDAPVVAERALPGVNQESIASASMFAGNGEQFSALGKGLQIAGSDAAQIAATMQDRQNVDKVFQAGTAFQDELTQFETAQKAKRGAEALADGGITQQTDKWFGETVQKHADTLENDAQRRTFLMSAGKMREQTLASLSQHQANEARASLTDSTNANIVSGINRAAANPADWTVAQGVSADIKKQVAALAKLNGYTPEVQAAKTGEMLTNLHKQVIQSLVADPATAGVAKTYFDKYKDEIDGSQQAEIGKFALTAAATSTGDGMAQSVWDKLKPANSTEPVKLADMEDSVRTQLKNNPEAMQHALAGLKERASSYEYQKKQEGNALESGVNNLILDNKFSRSAPEFIALSAKDPEAARKILTFIENQDYTRVARSAALEQKADAAEARAERGLHRDTMSETLRMSDPDVLVGMTRDEVINKLPVLGVTSTQALLARWDAFTKNGAALSEARIDNNQFAVFAKQAGIDPAPKKSDEAKTAQVNDLHNTIEAMIGAEQQAKKRALTRDEKDVIMKREIDNKVILHNSILPDSWSQTKKAVITLSADDMKTAYVEVGDKKQRVKLSEIPQPFRQQAIISRQRSGLSTSEQQLGELYLRATGKLK